MTEEERARLLKDCAEALRVERIYPRAARLARALKTLLENDGWQPIETAPRDGTRILVDFGRVGVHAVSWTSQDYRDKYNIWCVDDLKHGPFPLRRYQDEDVGGWRPLPAAPKGEG